MTTYKTLEQIQKENRKEITLSNNSEAKDYDETLQMDSGVGCEISLVNGRHDIITNYVINLRDSIKSN